MPNTHKHTSVTEEDRALINNLRPTNFSQQVQNKTLAPYDSAFNFWIVNPARVSVYPVISFLFN